MNKIFKIIAWVLAVIGIVLGIICFATSGGDVDILLRFTYFLLIAAVVIWVGLAIFLAGKSDKKSLIRAGIIFVAAIVVIAVAYVLASGGPALNVKTQPAGQWLKLTDTLLLLTYILGGAAIVAIVYGVIRNVINK